MISSFNAYVMLQCIYYVAVLYTRATILIVLCLESHKFGAWILDTQAWFFLFDILVDCVAMVYY